MAKSVHFSKDEDVVHYYNQEETFPSLMDSLKRTCVETEFLKKPYTELDRMRNLISSWRKNDISVVFGNLGRQPILLSYYLDLCFSHEDYVIIQSQWSVSSEYQRKRVKNADFVIYMEPCFGFTVHKYPSVKHLVILTSHLDLSLYENNDVQFYQLHLSNDKIENFPDSTLTDYEVFVPPIFHEKVYHELPDKILLDVSNSMSAHEAYLRFLTGKEIIRKKPFKLRMKERDRKYLKECLRRSKQRVTKLWNEQWMDSIYWNEFIY